MIPLSASYLRLISGVNFNNTYEHTRWFDSRAKQDTYFDSKQKVLEMKDCSFIKKDNNYVIRVNSHIDNLNSVNYLYFTNPHNSSLRYYCFVTSMEYIQQNTTAIYFTLDVIQSFMFQLSFKKSFIIREHQNRWNSDGSPVINRVPEDLDYGDTYETVLFESFGWDIAFLVIQLKEDIVDNKIKSSWSGVPQPLMNLVYPYKLDGSMLSINVDGEPMPYVQPYILLDNIYSNPETVNNVSQIYVTDRAGLNCSYDGTTLNVNSDSSTGSNYRITGIINGATTAWAIQVLKQIETNTNIHNNGDKYKAFNVSESKLLMYPYSLTTLDDFKGNRIDLKLENINADTLDIEIVGSLGSANKVSYNVKNYSHSSSNPIANMETSLINDSTNDIPIISDYTSAFIQGNMNTVKTKATTTAIMGANDVVTKSFQGIVDTFNRSQAVQVGSAFSSALATSSSLLRQRSKLKDIQNVPPNMVKQGGNSHFDYAFNVHGCHILHKTIKTEYKNQLTSYFQVYGYKVNRFGVPNIHTRESWNYIELEKANITGNINNDYLNTIKGVFQRGVTLWHVDDVLNYSLPNDEI